MNTASSSTSLASSSSSTNFQPRNQADSRRNQPTSDRDGRATPNQASRRRQMSQKVHPVSSVVVTVAAAIPGRPVPVVAASASSVPPSTTRTVDSPSRA